MPIHSIQRKPYLDTIKGWAIFIVYLTHFVVHFESPYARFWVNIPTSFVMRGITGSWGVAVLGVCLGYFASTSNEKNATLYVIRRYFFFFSSALFVNSVIAILAHTALVEHEVSHMTFFDTFKAVMWESIKLGDDIYPTFWCMLSFCLASIMAFFNGRADVKTTGLIIQIALFWISGQIWVAICLLGCITSRCVRNNIIRKAFSKPYIKAIVMICAFVMIQISEQKLSYLLDGISTACLILVIENSCTIKKILGARVLSFPGTNVMGVYLCHVYVYIIVGTWLFRQTAFLPYKYSFLITLLSCWGITLMLSAPTTKLLNTMLKVFTKKLKEIDAYAHVL